MSALLTVDAPTAEAVLAELVAEKALWARVDRPGPRARGVRGAERAGAARRCVFAGGSQLPPPSSHPTPHARAPPPAPSPRRRRRLDSPRRPRAAAEVLGDWVADIGSVLGLLDTTAHLIDKEYLVAARPARGARCCGGSGGSGARQLHRRLAASRVVRVVGERSRPTSTLKRV